VASITQAQVRTAGFAAFDSISRAELFSRGNVRVFGPNATVAQDLDPEYIAVSQDSTTAWVSIQEAPSKPAPRVRCSFHKRHSHSEGGTIRRIALSRRPAIRPINSRFSTPQQDLFSRKNAITLPLLPPPPAVARGGSCRIAQGC
jgi:hypothetical protein